MSEKKNLRRAKREARREKEAKNVVRWIFGVLVLLAFIFLAYSIFAV